MNDSVLTPDRVILGEHEYISALDLVIASAEEKLLIFDQDFSTGDYASIKRYDAIKSFLNKAPTTELIVILQTADFFTSQCPRLFDLLSVYGHKMTVYETNSRAKVAKDCFILADNKHYIRRFHIDQARFKFMLDDEETTSSLANRFDELLQETTHQITVSKLGL